MTLIIYFARYLTRDKGPYLTERPSLSTKKFLLPPTNIPSPLTCLINFRSIKQYISGYRPSCSSKYYSHNINHTGTVLSK